MCVRVLVSGKVQGVFFRASCAAQARALSVNGHARNLSDGGVEVQACGERGSVDQLIEWLHKGPVAARVDGVDVTPVACTDVAGFTTS